MIVEQTMEKLVGMKLHGMAEALRQWMEKPKERDLTPADLIGLLADAEWTSRENKKLSARLRNARFRQAASMEDIDYSALTRYPEYFSRILERLTGSSDCQRLVARASQRAFCSEVPYRMATRSQRGTTLARIARHSSELRGPFG